MAEYTQCSVCSRQVSSAGTHCPGCGHPLSVIVSPAPADVRLVAHPPSVVQYGIDPTTGDTTLRVHDPSGTTSEARQRLDGSVALEITGARGVGRPSEGRVAKTLRQRLAEDGHEVTILDGADDRGEDRLLDVDGRRFVLQVTTAPAAPDFWRDAVASSVRTDVTESHAASWLREPIAMKALRSSIGERRSIVLAIDARHAGVLGLGPLLTEYIRHYGPPVIEFGFASVWVVGPTVSQCARLGDGFP